MLDDTLLISIGKSVEGRFYDMSRGAMRIKYADIDQVLFDKDELTLLIILLNGMEIAIHLSSENDESSSPESIEEYYLTLANKVSKSL